MTKELYLSLAVIALFALLFASTADRPFQLDNVDFPAAAAQTARTGLPLYYRGEENPVMSALYHPPLYIYTLAAWMRLFGTGEAPVRLFGMTCALLQGLIVLAILSALFGGAAACRWAPFFWVLYLLNPFTMQTSTIADIDSTIYGPLLCSAILAVLWISWRDGEWRTDAVRKREYVLLAAALFLCLWAKLTTVLLTFPFVFFLLIARLGMKRAAIVTAAITATSIAAFAATYALFGVLTGLDVRETIVFTWRSFTQRGTNPPGAPARLEDYWINFRFMGPFMLSWTGLLPWVAAAAGLCVSIVAAVRRRDRRLMHYALVLGLALLCTVYYCGKVSTFSDAPFKYALVYWGIVLTAPLVLLAGREPAFGDRPLRTAALAMAAFAAGAVCSARILQDRLILNGFEGSQTVAAYFPAGLFLLGLVLKRPAFPAPGLAALTLAAFCGVQFVTVIYQERAPYSTTYDYGQEGFSETAAFIESNTRPDDVLVSMKDIGYRTQRRYYESYGALYYGDSARRWTIQNAIAGGRVAYMVFTERRGQGRLSVSPAFRDWLLQRCTLVRSFGDFRVYQLTEVLRKRRAAECANPASAGAK